MQHHRSTLVIATLFVLACFATGPVALGQGTSGSFPDPITVRQFTEWLGLAGLTAEERQDLQPLLEHYQEQFKQIRDGDIEKYLSATSMGGPERSVDDVKARVKARSRILDDIARLERSLFDQAVAAVASEREAGIERARARAERTRWRGVVGSMGLPGGSLDLGVVFDELDLTPEQRTAAYPSVQAYEQRLGKLVRELGEASVRQPVVTAEALAAAGIRRPEATPDNADANAFENYFRDRERIRAEAGRPLGELRKQIASTQRGLPRNLEPLLPEEAARRMREEMVKRAYPEAFGDEQSLESAFQAVFKAEGGDAVGSDERESVLALRRAYRSAYDRVTDEMLDEIDSMRKASGGFFMMLGGDDGTFERHEAKLDDLRARRAGVNESFGTQLDSIIGPDRAATVRRRDRDETEGRTITVSGMTLDVVAEDGGGVMIFSDGDGEAAGMFVTATLGGPGGPPSPLPPLMNRPELDAMAEALVLDPGQQPIVEVLYQEYAEMYGDAVRQADEESRSDRRPDDETRFEPPTPQDVEREFSARRRYLEQLAAIEATFFENLEGFFMGKPQQERLADAKGVRRRAWLDSAASVRVPGMMMLGPMGGRASSESSIDLVRLAGDTSLEPSSVEAIGPVLRQYASNATTLQQSRLETVLEGQRQIALFHARAVTRDQDGNVEVSISSGDDGFETMQKADQRIAAATKTVVDLNRSTLEQLETVLPPDQASVLQAAYDRAAFPAVFRDRGPARLRLESALKLELDDAQRAAVEAIQAEFVSAAADIRSKMVAAERAGGDRLGMGPEIDGGQLQRVQSRANEMRKLRFELSELDARTLQRLAAVLSPEQAKAIGGLEPQVEPDQSGGIQFLQMN